MLRSLVLVSASALLVAGASAQCIAPDTGTSIVPGILQWSSTSGFSSTYPIDDEGITSPPIAFTAFPNFPMAGAVGNLDQMWVNSNGDLYFTDSTQGLTQPVGGASFGINSLTEMRGNVAGGSPRIAVLGGDHEGSVAAGAAWRISVDQTVAGQVRVVWTDMTRFANTTDRFSFSCTLFASGALQVSLSGDYPDLTGRYVGISIGNMVGTGSELSQDLSAGADSGTLGMLYESFGSTGSFDLAGRTIFMAPNGTGGYLSVLTCTPAFHEAYGVGCYDAIGSSFYELFPDSPSAKATLEGNALAFTRTASGYNATWVPGGGAAFVAPSPAATPLAFSDGGNGSAAFVTSSPVPVPGGVTQLWTASVNGILTAGGSPNNGVDTTPSGADMIGGAAPFLGFYTWRDFTTTEAGSGPIVVEEAGGVVYVTWDGVEAPGTPSPNPSTWQFQITLATGDVLIAWVAFDGSTSTSDVLVGCTLHGGGGDPGSVSLSTAVATPVLVDLIPLTLAASPPPVNDGVNPTAVTYTIDNIPEFIPASGIYISTLFFSVASAPGIDLAVIGAPGCSAYIGGLDVNIAVAPSLTPTASTTFAFPPGPLLPPGTDVWCQAVSLFDPAFPLANGQNAFGLTTSNGLQSHVEAQ